MVATSGTVNTRKFRFSSSCRSLLELGGFATARPASQHDTVHVRFLLDAGVDLLGFQLTLRHIVAVGDTEAPTVTSRNWEELLLLQLLLLHVVVLTTQLIRICENRIGGCTFTAVGISRRVARSLEREERRGYSKAADPSKSAPQGTHRFL